MQFQLHSTDFRGESASPHFHKDPLNPRGFVHVLSVPVYCLLPRPLLTSSTALLTSSYGCIFWTRAMQASLGTCLGLSTIVLRTQLDLSVTNRDLIVSADMNGICKKFHKPSSALAAHILKVRDFVTSGVGFCPTRSELVTREYDMTSRPHRNHK
jgi:hypothetical protein